MTEFENGYDFEGEEGADIYNFSWQGTTEDDATAEIATLNKAINNVSKLLNKIYENNDYTNTIQEYNNLCNNYLGRVSWIQQFYYTNQDAFAPYIKTDSKPQGYHDWTDAKRKSFDLGLKLQRDAGWANQPLDQIQLLMYKVPLLDAFKLVRATITLDDSGFDEDLYNQVDTYVKEVAKFVTTAPDVMERITDKRGARYFQENYGTKSNSEVNTGYRKARLEDYLRSFEVYCPKAFENIKHIGNCTFHVDMQYLLLMIIIDEYMKTVADVLKANIDQTIEQCLDDSRKLAVVINSRREKCTTDLIKSTLTVLEDLNNTIFEICDICHNMIKNYKDLISAAPYCFMKKPPASESMPSGSAIKRMTVNTLSDGTRYKDLVDSLAISLSNNCHHYVYAEGRKELR